MTKSLRIAVADDEQVMRDYLKIMLPRLGHEVVSAAANGLELMEHFRTFEPNLVISDINMPKLDGLVALTQIYEQCPTPVILVSANDDSELIQRAQRDHVVTYLVKPVKLADVEAAIAIAVRQFEQFKALQADVNDLRQALWDRTIVERAKAKLMEQLKIDEDEAFRRLQQQVRVAGKRLVDVARYVLPTEETRR